jgi:hypothetical protein
MARIVPPQKGRRVIESAICYQTVLTTRYRRHIEVILSYRVYRIEVVIFFGWFDIIFKAIKYQLGSITECDH